MTERYLVSTTPERLAFAGEVTRAAEFRTGLRRFLRRTHEVCAAEGIDPSSYDLLLLIKAAGERKDWPIADLSNRLALAEAAAEDLIGNAERAGLLERRQTPGVGGRWLCLTDAGNGRLEAVLRSLHGERERLLTAFEQADADLQALSRSLEFHRARDW